ncbi:Annexin repeat, partial [Aphelenchoides avenae]
MHGPTVVPAPNFNARADAEKLRDVLNDKDSDTIAILCKRSNEQRQEIAKHYKDITGTELVAALKDGFAGEFRDLMVGLCRRPAEFYAWELHHSIKDHRVHVVVEILCSLSSHEVHEVSADYRRLFHHELCAHIRSHSVFRKSPVIEMLAKGCRDENTRVDNAKVNEALSLLVHRSPEKRDQMLKYEAFCRMLATDCYEQLRVIFYAYEKRVGYSVEDLVRKEFAGEDRGEALLKAVQTIYHPLTTFAMNLASFYNPEVK